MDRSALDSQVAAAVEVLKRGGIILYPTDTVWGIGCDATNAAAVERIYALKQSGDKKSMLILAENEDRLMLNIQKMPEVGWQLLEVADKPLTLILDGGCGVAENLLPEEKTIGIRIPKHEFCKALLHRLRRPLVSTSANISTKPTPKNFTEIDPQIIEGVDLVIDPIFEGNPTRKASSIIRLSLNGTIEIIRE